MRLRMNLNHLILALSASLILWAFIGLVVLMIFGWCEAFPGACS
jgi:hypothetical protein